MDPSSFVGPLVGGVMIGLAAAGLMAFSGRVAGISGIFGGLLSPKPGDLGWRVSFAAGLVVGGAVLLQFVPHQAGWSVEPSLLLVALGGLLVGFGAKLGSGCTSGHGVCGLARLGPRSVVATLTFLASGMLATFVVKQLTGGA